MLEMAAVGACVVERVFMVFVSVGAFLGKTRLGQRGPLPTSLPAVTHTQAPVRSVTQLCSSSADWERAEKNLATSTL